MRESKFACEIAHLALAERFCDFCFVFLAAAQSEAEGSFQSYNVFSTDFLFWFFLREKIECDWYLVKSRNLILLQQNEIKKEYRHHHHEHHQYHHQHPHHHPQVCVVAMFSLPSLSHSYKTWVIIIIIIVMLMIIIIMIPMIIIIMIIMMSLMTIIMIKYFSLC